MELLRTMTAKTCIRIVSTVAFCAVLWTLVPAGCRWAARGDLIADYIRRNGVPTAVASQCRVLPLPGRLVSIRLDGVLVYSESMSPTSLVGRCLIYPHSEAAKRHFRFLPSEEPINGTRSVYYSQRRLFFSERLTVVRVDASGRIEEVESRSYNTLTLYE